MKAWRYQTLPSIMEIKTDPRLLTALRAVAGRPMTRAELDEQRVSFVYGQTRSALTKDQVREILRRGR